MRTTAIPYMAGRAPWLAMTVVILMACGETGDRCRPRGGVSTSPATIAEVVTLINALPAPVTVDCYVESLTRPLHVNAAFSLISAQPSNGRRSPRIFIMSETMVSTLSPVGTGSELIEFGQFVDDARTIKAEVAFPVAEPLGASAPYDRVREPPQHTSCSGCHAFETRAVEVANVEAYASEALRPTDDDVVSLVELRRQYEACDARDEPERCRFLTALFAHGEVREKPFPATLPTIFE